MSQKVVQCARSISVLFVLLSCCLRAVFFILIMEKVDISSSSDYSDENNTNLHNLSFDDENQTNFVDLEENSSDSFDFLDESFACQSTQRNGAKRVGEKLQSKCSMCMMNNYMIK